MSAKYTENETGIVVEIIPSVFQWGVHPAQFAAVRYPDGLGYIVPIPDFNRHFTIITPQNIDIGMVQAGGINRPTGKQRELDEELKKV